jgi:Zn-dependent protease/CBS domain-containing protein
MTWSIPLGRVAGTAIRVHVTFFLLLLWIGMVAGAQGGAAAAWQGVIFILLVFVCVVLHEFGHILMARHFGVTTSDITLLPIGGVARLSRIPERPGQELLVALAGPAVNLVIALLLFAATGTRPSLAGAMGGIVGSGGMVARLASVNLFLLLFNLLPAFPMDGGRVLRALLGYRMGFVRATQIAASVGQGFAFALGILGLIGNPILLFIALFVYLGAASEAHTVQLRQVAEGMIAGDAMMSRYDVLPLTASLDEAVRELIRAAQPLFPVMDGQGRLQGVLTQAALISHLRVDGPDAVVADAMTPSIPTIHPYQPLSEALRLLQGGNLPAVAVVDAGDRLVGLITSETIGELMLTHGIRAARGQAPAGPRPTDGTRRRYGAS